MVDCDQQYQMVQDREASTRENGQRDQEFLEDEGEEAGQEAPVRS